MAPGASADTPGSPPALSSHVPLDDSAGSQASDADVGASHEANVK